MNKGIKINNNKSLVSQIPKPPNEAEIEKNARKNLKEQENISASVAELAAQLKSLFEDKGLSSTKGKLGAEIEKNTINEFISLADQINQDENQQESVGSLGLASLTLKLLFKLKDRVNFLEYSLSNALKKIDELEKK